MLAQNGLEENDFDSVIVETNILEKVASVLKRPDGGQNSFDSDYTIELKSKSINICVNLALGTQADSLIQPIYGVLPQINRVLDIHPNSQTDLDLLENSLWLLANLMSHSEILQE
jgi:hypothetical protein